MFSRGFASGLMSIREESPGRTGRFQGFAEPPAGNVLCGRCVLRGGGAARGSELLFRGGAPGNGTQPWVG